MLSSVLRSDRAIAINIQIMRTFVRMRELINSNRELAHRLNELEARLDKKLTTHEEAIVALLSAIRKLMNPAVPRRRPIWLHRRSRGKGLGTCGSALSCEVFWPTDLQHRRARSDSDA